MTAPYAGFDLSSSTALADSINTLNGDTGDAASSSFGLGGGGGVGDELEDLFDVDLFLHTCPDSATPLLRFIVRTQTFCRYVSLDAPLSFLLLPSTNTTPAVASSRACCTLMTATPPSSTPSPTSTARLSGSSRPPLGGAAAGVTFLCGDRCRLHPQAVVGVAAVVGVCPVLIWHCRAAAATHCRHRQHRGQEGEGEGAL